MSRRRRTPAHERGVSRSEVPGEHPSEREPVVTNARIIGAAEIDYERHPASELETSELLARAARLALEDAGVRPSDVDGFGVSSFTLSPDNCIDLVVRLGLRVSWMMDGKPDLGMSINGCLAGLVAITAPCAFVNPLGAVIIGLVRSFPGAGGRYM